MDWLRKLDAALDTALFNGTNEDPNDTPEEEEVRRNEFEFDYVSNVFSNDAPPITDDDFVHDETENPRTKSFQHGIHTRNVDLKRKSPPPPPPPLGLPGTLRTVLRTRGSDSSDESDDEDIFEGKGGEVNVLNDLKDAPRVIETVMSHNVSPISSPGKKTLHISYGVETLPSHLKSPFLDEKISNLDTCNDDDDNYGDLQKSKQQHINPNDEPNRNEVNQDANHVMQSLPFRPLPPPPPPRSSITTPSTTLTPPPLRYTSSSSSSPRRHKSPIVIMPSEETIVQDVTIGSSSTVKNDVVEVDSHQGHHVQLSLQHDENQHDRSSLDNDNDAVDLDAVNPPFIIEATQSMDIVQSTSMPSQFHSMSDDMDTMKTNTITNEKSEEIRASLGDFMPSYHYNDDEDDALSDISALEGEDYDHGTILPWDNDVADSNSNFKPSMNCHGVVHVRLLRAQHMPCSSGVVVQAIINLPPWKGKVRSKTETTYMGPSKAGVCARWDKRVDHGDDLSLDEDDGQPPCISMVHAYNDEDTPIPDIVIEMKDIALQMFESDLCSLSLSCAPLMASPGQFLRRWCRMNISEKAASNQNEVENVPLLLIEASFEPTNFDETVSLEAPADDNVIELNLEANAALEQSEERKSSANAAETNDNSSQAQLSARTKTSQSQKKLSSKPHMFRNYTMLRPTFCVLCDKMIMWKFKGYQCEVCHLDCCSDCLLRIDVEMPCGSKSAKNEVDKRLKSRFDLSKVYDIIAPYEVGAGASDTNEEPLDPNLGNQNQQRIEGVGKMHLKIKQACVYSEHFAPEAEIKHILASGDRWLRKGDYYVRVSWTGGTDTKRTKTVFQTSKPRFDSAQMSITA